jgi:hypothetical protein
MAEWQFWLLMTSIFFSNFLNPNLKDNALIHGCNNFMFGLCLGFTVMYKLAS